MNEFVSMTEDIFASFTEADFLLLIESDVIPVEISIQGGTQYTLVSSGQTFVPKTTPYIDGSNEYETTGPYRLQAKNSGNIAFVTISQDEDFNSEEEISFGGIPVLVRRKGNGRYLVKPPSGTEDQTTSCFLAGYQVIVKRYGNRWYFDL